MNYYLVCVHPFGSYAKGQMITDPDEVAKLMIDRDHHFVKKPAPDAPPAPPAMVSAAKSAKSA